MADSFRTAELRADIPRRALRQLDGKYHRPIRHRIAAIRHAFLRFQTSLSNFMDLQPLPSALCLPNGSFVLLRQRYRLADLTSSLRQFRVVWSNARREGDDRIRARPAAWTGRSAQASHDFRGITSQSQASGRILLATVVDASGKTLVDFGVDDFLIQEAGDEREVLDVHVADYPIVVLIDDAPQSSDLGPIKSAIARFIARVGERPVAVGTLSKPSELVASLEDAREEVLERAREYHRDTWQRLDAPGRRSRRPRASGHGLAVFRNRRRHRPRD